MGNIQTKRILTHVTERNRVVANDDRTHAVRRAVIEPLAVQVKLKALENTDSRRNHRMQCVPHMTGMRTVPDRCALGSTV